ncbi:MAG: peptidylprolyl isomerase [SAR86 cluster bacterium]|uniref:peptidylprolyl isomerase n=1 Tax=SAR86 cluster bacterium TaxID=2030880 RepID=A0A2A5AW17_9GAMM|nr:MAG: peptidylprolyl isomerase [SAR86 cluster bacterium]
MFSSKLSNFLWLRLIALPLLVISLSIQFAYGNTIVRVSTSVGDYSIELFDDITPGTVTNFLNYVNSGRYNGTVIHRSEPGFVIQGGWMLYDDAQASFFTIATDPNIANEFNLSNIRGTLAMAKQGGDPNSANSQWFINLTDNSFLDSDNGGFTVFGKVLGDGMDVVDAISNLPRWILTANSPFPTIDFNGANLSNANMVNVTMSVVEQSPEPANFLDASTGLLRVKVDAGESGLAAITFSVNSTEPEVIIQLDLNSIVPLTETVENIASFDGATGRLVLPELVVDGVVAYRNVIFLLSDEEQFLFTLESFD